MSKEIDQDKDFLKGDIARDRKYLGPYPLNEVDSLKWDKICEDNRYMAQTLNSKINKFNLIVPLINKQKFQVQYEELCQEILENGSHSVEKICVVEEKTYEEPTSNSEDIFGLFFKAISNLLTFERKK